MSFDCAAQKACASAQDEVIENQKGQHMLPFETESTSGLERSDGGCLVCIGFDEHVKSAEGEGGVGFLR